jgi:hypothetical protein
MRNSKFPAVVLLSLLVVPTIAKAQNLAAITGSVTDRSGGAIVGAGVKLVDTRIRATHEAKTGVDGTYRIVDIPPGPGYTLTVSKDGFQTFQIGSLYLPVASTATQDVRLEIGTIDQAMEVTAQGSVSLNTTDATIGNNFDMRAVEELPIELRDNPALLLQQQPGVTPTVDTADDPLQSREGAVTGARADQNNIIVDGIDAQNFDIGEPFSMVAAIPVDAIQEFRTDVANPIADIGRGSGATTVIVTKSGTNDWHGMAQEWNRTAATEANDFFNKLAGVPRTRLVRNQFGGNLGGPVKKDKLFFFFDYAGRRDAKQDAVLRIVPLDHVRRGEIGYINSNPGCSPNSRLNITPNCITIVPATGAHSVASLDPLGTGADQALLRFVNSRPYPNANDLTQGDGINTGGVRFNAPVPLSENIYLARIDYVLSSKHKLFARFNFNNETSADDLNNGSPITGVTAPIEFPGDPISQEKVSHDKAWVVGDTWTISPNTVNQFVYGESRNEVSFQHPYNPNGNIFQFNWMNNAFDPPYLRQSALSFLDPIVTFRDDVSTLRGTHTLQFGGVFKPIRTRDVQIDDFNFIGIGLGGPTTTLDPTLRPPDILSDPTIDPTGIATSEWDNLFMGMLGAWWQDVALFNYTRNGTALPNGSPHRVDYRYYEYETYFLDTWRVRKNLTFSYGLRYQYDSVPYETNGVEAIGNVDFATEFSTRVANGLKGVSGFDSAPLLSYGLAGKANRGAPSLYEGNKRNFSPRLAVAWNPSFTKGLLGNIVGERKTVFRLAAAVLDDHTALNSINFLQDQNSFLFGNQNGASFGGNTPRASLQTDPRFTGINDLPISPPPSAPPFVNPLTPFESRGVVNGLSQGATNYSMDRHFKTPYQLSYSAGLQRELPGNLQLELDYVGRFGRKLLALADASQIVDFKDPASGQTLIQAVTALETEARRGAAKPTTQPFFENQCGSGCTQTVYSGSTQTLQLGNLGGLVDALALNGQLPPGVGLPAQFQDNLYAMNKGWSSYNGLLVTLRKRFSHNLQGDFNYTFSHSLDDFSVIANNNGTSAGGTNGVVCDVRSLAVCRGNSEFDITHSISADAIYNLPIGRGKWIGRNVSRWVNQIIGGWEFSDLTSWHTGSPFNPLTGVETTSLLADSLGVFNGNRAALTTQIHQNPDGAVQLFAKQASALGAFRNPLGQQVGNRNILRGPHFSNWDMALVKNFNLLSEQYKLQFRAEAYNAFNHPNFALPIPSVNSPQFGVISTTAASPRAMQLALRFDF